MTDPTTAVADLWRDESSPDYGYFVRAEDESWTSGFWAADSLWRPRFDAMDRTVVLEIAAGQGRHAVRAAEHCGRLVLTDTSARALEVAAARLATSDHVSTVVSVDGMTIPIGEHGRFTGVYSYDAMVHFEASCVASYVGEIARLLAPGGTALLHHSNYAEMPTAPVTDAPGWRNFMTMALLAHIASRCGLEVVEQQAFDWVAPLSDAFTVLRKPAHIPS